MAKNKLSGDDLKELRQWRDDRAFLNRLLHAVEFASEWWKLQTLRSKGIDTSIPYEINYDTGVIKPKDNGNKRDKVVSGDGSGKVDEGVSGLEVEEPA